MKYERKFTLQACHFNDEDGYEVYREAVKEQESKPWVMLDLIFRRVLPKIHGHNFEVTVTAEGGFPASDKANWLVSDTKLEAIVREWDNCNLSVHPDFDGRGIRATTENMACGLWGKLRDAFKGVTFTVRVRENSEIEATYP